MTVEKNSEMNQHSNLLIGNGVAAKLFRAIDWSTHPLGPIENWPSCLKISLNNLFLTRLPMFIWWGSDLIQFFNDAFIPNFKPGLHHVAMGQRGEDCWQDIWPLIKPQIDLVMKDGKSTWNEEQPIPNHKEGGQLQNLYWSYGYSPIICDDGSVGGALVVCFDVTQKVLAQVALRESEDRLSQAIKSGNMGFWDWNIKTGYVYLSQALMLDLGVEPKTFKNTLEESFNCVHPDDRANMWVGVQKTVTHQVPFEVEFRVQKANGEMVWFSSKGRCIAGENNSAERITGTTSDITSRVLARKRIEEDELNIRNEKEKLKAIFYGINSAMIILKGPNLIFEMVNEKYLELIQGRDVIGQTVEAAFPTYKNSKILSLLKQVYDTGTPQQVIDYHLSFKKVITNTYEDRYFDLTFSRVSGDSLKEYLIVGHVIDVTEKVLSRKRLERSEAETRLAYKAAEQSKFELYSFFMQAPSPMAIMSGPEHEFLLANPLYEKLVGRSVLGKKIRDVFTIEESENLVKLIDHTYQTGEPFVGKSLPFQIVEDGRPNDLRIDVSYTAFRDSHGNVKGVLVFVRDVTDEFNIRAHMEQYNIELMSAKAEAERANELKSAFLANMSHEIRTPLGAILGFTEIIRNANISIEDQNHYLDIITRNGNALTKIIDDILDLSKIEAGKLEIETAPLCLKELTQDIVAMFQDRVEGKGLNLIFEDKGFPGFIIDSDPIRIRQVLINLIGNAIKFTNQGSITLYGEFQRQENDSVHISIYVKDTGSGMTLKQSERLFKPFTQGDSTSTRNHGGTGLGLALSKKLGWALGGDVTLAEFEVGHGCVFKFELEAVVSKSPENWVPTAVKDFTYRNGKVLEGYKVLVVDDSADNRTLIDLILKREGALVQQASGGEEALKMVLTDRYDAVLMDIQMPGLDGYETLAKLRSENFQTPILALTAQAMIEERTRAIESGFNDHITKPINSKNLIDSILTHARPNLH